MLGFTELVVLQLVASTRQTDRPTDRQTDRQDRRLRLTRNITISLYFYRYNSPALSGRDTHLMIGLPNHPPAFNYRPPTPSPEVAY